MTSDVEKILTEIRERVLAEESAAVPSLDVTQQAPSLNGSSAPVVPNEVLERVAAGLTVTARAWDRLPPVLSNRRGLPARMELWIKNRFKPLTRWFTWEQVNFNSAVHHALNDLLAVVAAQGRELAAVREDAVARNEKLEALERELHSLRSLLETQAQELQRLHSLLETRAQELQRLHSLLETRAQELQRLHSAQAKDSSEAQARLTQTEAALAGFNDMFSGLAQQVAETANELREEQRVCFKQLSLEASEAAILEDRGRRALEARMEKLEHGKSP